MAILASAAYDPASAASAALTSTIAMTALDTTNLRLTFTAPANGTVLVRARSNVTGHTATQPRLFLGVLDGATVKCRMPATWDVPRITLNASNMSGVEGVGIVTGLTPGNSYTWDLAYGVEFAGGTSCVLKWGGPNDASGADAWGAAHFEIWETTNLLAGTMYDPGTAVVVSTALLKAMTAFDTTNLRLTFTAPSTGKVFWRIRTVIQGNNSAPLPTVLLGILESSTVVCRQAPVICPVDNGNTNGGWVIDASGVISGVSAGSHTYDAAYAIQLTGGSANERVKYGGPDNNTADDAFGGFLFELWSA